MRPGFISQVCSYRLRRSFRSLVYGMTEVAAYGWQVLPVVALLVGVICSVVFVRQQRTLTDPLLDVTLFQKPAFTIMLIAMLINTMFPGGVMVLSTQYLQLVAGLSPLQAGLWMCSSGFAVLLFTEIQLKIPGHLMGRVMGLLMFSAQGLYPISTALAGVLATHFGPVILFPLGGLILALTMLIAMTQKVVREL